MVVHVSTQLECRLRIASGCPSSSDKLMLMLKEWSFSSLISSSLSSHFYCNREKVQKSPQYGYRKFNGQNVRGLTVQISTELVSKLSVVGSTEIENIGNRWDGNGKRHKEFSNQKVKMSTWPVFETSMINSTEIEKVTNRLGQSLQVWMSSVAEFSVMPGILTIVCARINCTEGRRGWSRCSSTPVKRLVYVLGWMARFFVLLFLESYVGYSTLLSVYPERKYHRSFFV